MSGFLIFNNDFSLRILCGIILALLGVIIYTEENRQQQLLKAKSIPTTIN